VTNDMPIIGNEKISEYSILTLRALLIGNKSPTWLIKTV
jgi:hypothetical protein